MNGKGPKEEGESGSGDQVARPSRCEEGARRVQGGCREGARRVQAHPKPYKMNKNIFVIDNSELADMPFDVMKKLESFLELSEFYQELGCTGYNGKSGPKVDGLWATFMITGPVIYGFENSAISNTFSFNFNCLQKLLFETVHF